MTDTPEPTVTEPPGPPPQAPRVEPQPCPFSVITSNHGFTPDGQALVRLEFSHVTGSTVLFAPAGFLPQIAATLMKAVEEAPKIQIAPAGASLPGLTEVLGGKK